MEGQLSTQLESSLFKQCGVQKPEKAGPELGSESVRGKYRSLREALDLGRVWVLQVCAAVRAHQRCA